MVQILQGLSYKVCTTTSQIIFAFASAILVFWNPTIIHQQLVVMLRGYMRFVYRMGENSSLSFTCYVITVPVDDFKLVQVVLHRSAKNLSKRFINKSKITCFIHRVVLADLEISLVHST